MIDLRCGDCLEVLRTLPDGSVHTCVTSPPYWGLRDYGTAHWVGGDEACDHAESRNLKRGNSVGLSNQALARGDQPHTTASTIQFRDLCRKCGARRVDDQIGLEATPDAFVGRMVEVFREVRRVLRDDGTLWLNLGDSYNTRAHGPGGQNFGVESDRGAAFQSKFAPGFVRDRSLKNKDLVGIPWRVAFALQADGYYLRSDIVWAKPNPMPESVRDRPTKSHEYLFLMAKSERYFWDAEAVREETQPFKPPRGLGEKTARIQSGIARSTLGSNGSIAGRNIRSVWTVATRAYKGCHFATFPPRLVEPCILAGTSERGCCPGCGKPWERVVERTPMVIDRSGRGEALGRFGRSAASGTMVEPARSETLGWRPTCTCHGRFVEIDDEPENYWVKPRRVYVPDGPQPEPVPCVVLDPFMGSGTTGAVAAELGRSFVGIELNPEYLKLAEARIAGAKVA